MFKRILTNVKNRLQGIVANRLLVFIFIIIVLFVILIGRLFVLQIVNGQEYLDGFTMQIQKTKNTQGTRGNIYDRTGKLIAYNELAYSVTIEDNGEYDSLVDFNRELNETIQTTMEIVERNGDVVINNFGIILDAANNYKFVATNDTQLLRFIADVYGETYIEDLSDEQQNSTADDIMNYLCTNEQYGYGIDMKKMDKAQALKLVNVRYAISLNSFQKYIETTIAEDVSKETVAEIMENMSRLQGVDIKEESLRRYNEPYAFASVIGYTGGISQEEYNEMEKDEQKRYFLTDEIGKSGLEAELETYLKGESGSVKLFVDNEGKIVETAETKEAKAGNDVHLTLDMDLQVAAYNILEQEVAGVLLSRLRNILDYDRESVEDASDLVVPIGDAYDALVSNDVLSIRHMKEEGAGATEAEVNGIFEAKKAEVLGTIEALLRDPGAASYEGSSEEIKAYLNHITDTVLTSRYQVLVSEAIDRNDEVYKQWHDEGSINIYTYLNHAIGKNWIDASKIKAEESTDKYSDSSELYNSLVDYIVQAIDNDNTLNKLAYRYLIKAGTVTGRQLCLILYEQNVLPFDQDQYNRLADSSLGAYDFLRGKIETLSITPGQLALEPCTGSLILTENKTGNVLACVSYPGYDNNRLANTMDSNYYNKLVQDQSTPFYNKVTQEATAPGSTYKPISAIAALTEGVVDTSTIINCTGTYEKVNPNPKCWIYPGAHGALNVTGAIAHSCNIFFYESGYRMSLEPGEGEEEQYSSSLGTDTLKKYAAQFGLDEVSGLELPESEPKMSDEASVPSAIGQGTNNFTTSQLVKYIGGVANRGEVKDLTLLNNVTDTDKNVVKEFDNKESTVVEGVADSSWDSVHQGMEQVIPQNFIAPFASLTNNGITVAGKSGTAQQSKTNADHALFVGFAPASNPEVSFAIRITNGYSSTYAAEVAGDMLSVYYNTKPREEIITGAAKSVSASSSHSD